MRTAILVTGTPGVGKTTVSQMLATKLAARYIGVTEIVKKENLVSKVDTKRDTLVADMRKVAERLQEILEESEDNVVIDGHYAVDVVPKKEVTTVFVLRRDPQKLKTTLEERGYSEKKVWENLASEILDVCLWDAVTACGINKVCEVDISDKSPETVIEEILLVLENKKECKVGTVDWMTALEKAGKLDDYMKKVNLTQQS